MPNSTDIKSLTNAAKKAFAAMNEAEASVYRDVNLAAYRAWKFGKILIATKEKMEHGVFTTWRAASFPKISERAIYRCQELYVKNSKLPELAVLNDVTLKKFAGELNADSVRKHRLGYVPDKDRPKQTGDVKFPRPSHHMSVVLELNKLQRRIEAKQVKVDEDELRRDFEPAFRWLCGLFKVAI